MRTTHAFWRGTFTAQNLDNKVVFAGLHSNLIFELPGLWRKKGKAGSPQYESSLAITAKERFASICT